MTKKTINLQQLIERETIDNQLALEDRRLVWQIARQKEFSYLYEIALTLEAWIKESTRDTFDRIRSPYTQFFYLENLYNAIEQALFIVPGSIDTLINMISVRPAFVSNSFSSYSFHPRIQRERYYASSIATYQPLEDILAAMEKHTADEKDLEILFLLTHELVLQAPNDDRGRREHPLLKALHQRMHELAHPLAWLPLYKTILEQGIIARKYEQHLEASLRFPGRASYEVPFTHWLRGGPEPGIPPFEGGAYPQINQMPATADTDYRRIVSAVLNWMVESNGRFEAHCVAFDAPFPQELLTPSTLWLGFEAFQGVYREQITFQPISAQEVYSILFRSAAIGGDLGGECFGAYGRLYAWQSLAGLTGAPIGASIETVLETAQQSTCFYVWAPSQWFCQVVTEFGLYVLRPDRQSGAFLAATDSD